MCNRIIFKDYKAVQPEELWDQVHVWSALWASVSLDFRDSSLSSTKLDMLNDVK